jgi:hypothetical protein
MNRSLLVVALFFFAAPGYSMTATVASTAQAAAAPSAPGAATAGTATTGTAASNAAKPAMPNASSVTRPSAVLSAPGVPPKGNAVPARTGASRFSGPILPSVAPQAVQPGPTSAGWAATSDSSSGMRRGTLQAFNASAGTFQVYGQKLTFNPQQVKVFNADGRPGSVSSLKSGASIRFTLDTTDLLHRRVAVIYVN